MKLLCLNDKEYSLLQNILNNFVLHGIESIPNDGSCNVLKMNERVNELKDAEPIGYMSNDLINAISEYGNSTVYKKLDDRRDIPVYIEE